MARCSVDYHSPQLLSRKNYDNQVMFYPTTRVQQGVGLCVQPYNKGAAREGLCVLPYSKGQGFVFYTTVRGRALCSTLQQGCSKGQGFVFYHIARVQLAIGLCVLSYNKGAVIGQACLLPYKGAARGTALSSTLQQGRS